MELLLNTVNGGREGERERKEEVGGNKQRKREIRALGLGQGFSLNFRG